MDSPDLSNIPQYIHDAIRLGFGQLRRVDKGETILYQGEIASRAYYVIEGLLRSYSLDQTGKVHVFMFAPEGWIISDVQSFTFSEPSNLFIDAMEPSLIIELNQSYLSVQSLNEGDVTQAINKLLRRISILQQRVIMLMSASAAERYAHFLETYPDLVNRVPLKWIASYLGITPEALSTIRSRIKEK